MRVECFDAKCLRGSMRGFPSFWCLQSFFVGWEKSWFSANHSHWCEYWCALLRQVWGLNHISHLAKLKAQRLHNQPLRLFYRLASWVCKNFFCIFLTRQTHTSEWRISTTAKFFPAGKGQRTSSTMHFGQLFKNCYREALKVNSSAGFRLFEFA